MAYGDRNRISLLAHHEEKLPMISKTLFTLLTYESSQEMGQFTVQTVIAITMSYRPSFIFVRPLA